MLKSLLIVNVVVLNHVKYIQARLVLVSYISKLEM